MRELKKQMYKAIERHGIGSKEVLRISQQLDTLIVNKQKKRYERYKMS